MKRRGHATRNVYCVVVKILMSQQDILYLANHPQVNRHDSGREHCYTRNYRKINDQWLLLVYIVALVLLFRLLTLWLPLPNSTVLAS